ncbi:MAG: hypothetical protein K0R55_2644 [Sporomusa sp.]|jgi:hypothetical protein|nr:hypothetical protein [Sporomusa sp.]
MVRGGPFLELSFMFQEPAKIEKLSRAALL